MYVDHHSVLSLSSSSESESESESARRGPQYKVFISGIIGAIKVQKSAYNEFQVRNDQIYLLNKDDVIFSQEEEPTRADIVRNFP